MPDLNLKVTPVFGESKYSYTLIHDFLEARIRDELKVRFYLMSRTYLHIMTFQRMVVLPSMDDQLLPLFRDWVIDVMYVEILSSSPSLRYFSFSAVKLLRNQQIHW